MNRPLPPRTDQLGRAAVFVAVAQSESFTDAAATLGMARSTVSQQVQQLETAMGVRLLERTTRTVTLTEEGSILLEYMRTILGAWGDAQDQFDERQGEPVGHVRITAPAGFTTALVGPALAEVLARHTGLTAELIIDDGIRDLVGEGIDLAIRAAELDDSRLVARRLGRMPLRLVTSAAFAAHLEQDVESLAALPWVGHTVITGSEVHLYSDASDEPHRVRCRTRAVASSGEGQVSLLLGGAGIALMPWPLVAAHVASGQLIASRRWYGRTLPLYAIYPGRRLLPARTRALLDAIVDRLPPLLSTD